jgi:glutamyl-tRNA synthetase
MTSGPIVRFAPSPTGRMHIGNARTALLNWLYVRPRGGRFILRFDDTDLERSKLEYAEAIEKDLAWLGIAPDLMRRQSERMAAYDAAAERLKAQGRLYPAYETAEELDRRRRRQQALGRPPIYDRAALRLSDAERAALEASGRRPHWRFRLEPRTVRWDDMVRGESRVDSESLSDPVLRREDGSYLYTLPSVVDDIDFGVTHVIRGEDHVTNTGAQIQIFEALAGAAPRFGHHNLLTDAGGEGLSKRTGALSIASLREKGVEPLGSERLRCSWGRRKPCARSFRSTNSPRWSTSPIFRVARRVSTKPNSTPSRRGRSIICHTRRLQTGSRRSESRGPALRPSGLLCGAISPASMRRRSGGRW